MTAVARITGILLTVPVLALAAERVDVAPAVASAPPPVSDHVLDVPYLSQTEALCGGAAAAMVLRYWGARGVQSTDFESLVDRRRAGIDTAALADSLTERGWRAYAFTGSRESLRHHLGRGRPVIVLLRVAPERFHYVVVLAWTATEVVVHDPATRPSQGYPAAAFEAAWAGSSRWALLVLPVEHREAESRGTRASASLPHTPPPASCAPALDRAVEFARQGALASAEATLQHAASLCPQSSALWREAASVSLLRGRPEEAVSRAARAVSRDPDDRHAWQVLGTARFLGRDDGRALDAWNHTGGPTLDMIRVDGLARTRHRVVTDATGLSPGAVLTASELARARRRLRALPTLQAARLDYIPVGNGLVEVAGGVVERPLLPTSRMALVALGVRAAVDREVGWDVAGATGGGEVLSASWRWWEERPRATVGLALPLSGLLTGVLQVEGIWERQAYRTAAPQSAMDSERRSLEVSLADWTALDLGWRGGVRLDRWRDRGAFAGVSLALDQRLARDHLALAAATSGWSGNQAFGRASVAAAWRSAVQPSVWSLMGSARATAVSDAAPLDLWPGAGTGHGRDELLRAHPLLTDGTIDGEAFGRRLVNGTIEASRALTRLGLMNVRAAGFLDAARSWRGLRPGRTHVDVGLGLRVGLAGHESGLRVDYAHGLADGANALSVGWSVSWPWQAEGTSR